MRRATLPLRRLQQSLRRGRIFVVAKRYLCSCASGYLFLRSPWYVTARLDAVLSTLPSTEPSARLSSITPCALHVDGAMAGSARALGSHRDEAR